MAGEGEFVLRNERGGILSALLIIPAVVVLIAAAFLLGYYTGRRDGRSSARVEDLVPLPDVAPQNLPKPGEFTFYKTLTEKEDRTVSLDLRPKASVPGGTPDKKINEGKREASPQQKVKDTPIRGENKSAAQAPVPTPEKKKVPAGPAFPKLRYSIQISAYREKKIAEDDLRKMKQHGFAAFIVSSEAQGTGTWYRVRLGSFTKKEAAEKLQKEVRAKTGISSLIVLE